MVWRLLKYAVPSEHFAISDAGRDVAMNEMSCKTIDTGSELVEHD
jgi:hypothetical protein